MKASHSLILLFTLIPMFSTVSIRATHAAEAPVASDTQQAGPVTSGLRVFTWGHSFHATVIPALVSEIAASANIKGHTDAGISMIGASRAIQHFEVPDAQNRVKPALIEGKVDVLTLSCMENPDEGISSFAHLAVEHNPNIRVTVQELWIPQDHWPFDARHPIDKSAVNFDASTIKALKETHEP